MNMNMSAVCTCVGLSERSVTVAKANHSSYYAINTNTTLHLAAAATKQLFNRSSYTTSIFSRHTHRRVGTYLPPLRS